MSKLIQALLTGIFFTFMLDGFLFIGILLNYIHLYEIPVYYNILFADHQCWLLFAALTILIGFITIYLDRIKITAIILGAMFAITALALIPSVGEALGANMLKTKNVTLQDARYLYHGDIYYEGRDFYYMYDNELQKFITLYKKDIKK
ncbi:MAG TPA: hypothetical protein ENK65_01380 [Helicobacteraceae bacterium]|nr:hypothetical protein [Helicobacteraceae bacterium]